MPDIKALHEYDWDKNKPDNSFFDGSVFYSTILREIAGLKPKRILDLGCGSGFFSGIMGKLWPDAEIDGVDIAQTALERAKRVLTNAWCINIDISDVPRPAGYYDLIVCLEVIEHLYDVDHALEEISRLLKGGGVAIIISTPNLAFWRFRFQILADRLPTIAADERHLHQFTCDHLKEEVTGAGLIVQKVMGSRKRLPFLAKYWPQLFSETLIVRSSNEMAS